MKYINGNVYFRNKILNIYPYVSKDLETDICIIGGGAAGLITAYFLSKQFKKIIIIEKNIIGFGNSSCEFGILDLDISKILKTKTQEEIIKIINLYNDAKKDFIEIAEKIGYTNIQEMKKVIFTSKIMQKSGMQKYVNIQKEYNINCHLKDKDSNINSNLNIEFEDKILVIDIYEFIQKLALYLSQNLNVEIYENTEIISIKDKYDEVELITNNDFYINAKKMIYCNGIEFLNVIELPDVEIYKRCNIVTKNDETIKDKEMIYYNYNAEDINIVITNNGMIMFSDNSMKINIKFQDEEYRKYIEEDKYTKLIVYLNKLLNKEEYLEAEYCYSYLLPKTVDGMPYIDELECKNNCFCNIPLGQNTILSSIIGGKMLKNMVNGLFTKEMKFFKLTRGNCN